MDEWTHTPWSGWSRAHSDTTVGEFLTPAVGAVLEQVASGVILCDGQGRLVLNRAARHILGGAPASASLDELFRRRAFREDGRPFAPEDFWLSRALAFGESFDPEYVDIERLDGTRAVILFSAAPIRDADGEIEGAIGIFADVSHLVERERTVLRAERAASDRVGRLVAFTAALAETWTTERVAASAIGRGRIAAQALDASLYLVDRAQDVVRLAESTHSPGMREQFAEIPLGEEGRFPIADAIRSRRPIFLETREAYHAAYPHLPEDRGYEHLPGLCVASLPLLLPEDRVGAVVFTYGEDHALDEGERSFLEVLARQISLAVERARLFDAERAARAEAEAANARSAFLSEAAQVLASSLDYEATLATVAKLAVPRIADWCSVDLAEDYWAGRPAAIVAHVDPIRLERARDLQRQHPPDLSRRRGVPEVLRSGRPELYSEISDEMLAAFSDSPERAAAVALEIRSAMIVPMVARGRVLGTMTFGSSRPGRHGATDLEMATHLARRAGIAIDNAGLYQEAQQAVRARDRVLAFVSHDLKNPLQAVMFATTMLERGAAGEPRKKHLSVLRRAGARMDRLVRDLLDLSSLEAGRFALSVRPVDPASLLADILAQHAPIAEHAGVTLASQVAQDAPEVSADRDRLVQVLSNLIGNALAFTPRGGTVTVRCRTAGRALRFEVADTGKGIPLSNAPHVFDAFWRSDDSHEGTGLGLAIARGLVEAHGGTIGFESEPGRGTTFFFTIPSDGRGPAGAGERT